MPQDYFDYTQEKLISFENQIKELLASDFPIPQTKDALIAIRRIFERDITRLHSTRDGSVEIKKQSCANANLRLKKFLPLLGFILRSTNVRNSFELADPLTRLAKRLLQDDITFVLSSEWDFSPLTYTFSFQELPDVILLGLPSFESANALVVPLAGHELGHWIWRREHLDLQILSTLQENILNSFRDNWGDFQQIFGDKFDIGDIKTDTNIHDIWTVSFDDAMRQCEEVFADFIGLKLFGTSYLHAFEYLVGPFTGEPRSRDYPDMKTRAEFLGRAAGSFSIACPSDYAGRFDDSATSSSPADRYLLQASDAATHETVGNILSLATDVSGRLKFPALSDSEAARCLERIKLGMPAESIEYIGDIINAGWAAYRDDSVLPGASLGGRRRIDALNELLMKSIEVAELEARMKCC